MNPEKLARIRELSKKNKEGTITPDEQVERKTLHQEYLQIFRQGMRQHIENIKVIDPQGNDITSEKVKEIKKNRQEFKQE